MRRFIRLALLALATATFGVAACGRTSWDSDDLRVLGIESPREVIRPGLHGVPVRVRLYNHGRAADDVRVVLSFRDEHGARDFDFDHREVAPLFDGRIARHGTAEVLFEIDVLTTATARDVVVEALLVLGSGGEPSGTFHAPLRWRFAPVRDLVVDTVGDAVTTSGGRLTLREAILAAGEEADVDRILFDPAVFPPDAPAKILLEGPLPAILGTSIVDASSAGVVLEPAPSWPVGPGYAMEIRGNATVRGLEFREFLSRYPPSGDPNCTQSGNGIAGAGPIVVTSGADVAIVDSSFTDPAALAQTRCHAAPIRVYGQVATGLVTRRVRVLRNDLLYLPWYGIQVAGIAEHAVLEGNRLRGMQRGAAFLVHDNPGRVSLVGNVASDGPVQGVFLARNGAADVLHNAFARLSSGAGETVYFETDMPALVANNVYQSNGGGAAIRFLAGGTGATITHEAASSKPLVVGAEAVIDTAGMLTGVPLRIVVPSAGTLGITVLEDSLLVDSGADVADRNGAAPGRWSGRAPDRAPPER